MGGQHAVPALEARDLPRRRRPIRSSSTGRRASRPRARSATSTRTSSTWCRRCWTRSASTPPTHDPRRHAVARSRACRSPTRSTTPRPRRRHHTQYFEMMGHRVDLSRRLARGVPGARAVVHRGGHGLRRDGHHRGQAARARRQGLGALPRRRGLLGDQEPRRRAPRQADRDDRALVRRGGQVQRAADRRARHGAPRRRAAAARADRATSTSTTRARRWSRTRSRRACSTGRTASPRRSRSPNGAEGVLVAQGGSTGGYALYVKDHKLHYAYNFLGVQQFHLATDATVGDGRHELRFEFEPTGQARPRATARGRRRTRSSTSTASWPARATCRSPSRSTSASPRACRAGATTARR